MSCGLLDLFRRCRPPKTEKISPSMGRGRVAMRLAIWARKSMDLACQKRLINPFLLASGRFLAID